MDGAPITLQGGYFHIIAPPISPSLGAAPENASRVSPEGQQPARPIRTIRHLPNKTPRQENLVTFCRVFVGNGRSVNFRLDKSESHARLLGKASQVWPVGQAEALFKGSAQSLRRSRHQVSGVRGGIQDMDSDPTLLLMKPVRQGPPARNLKKPWGTGNVNENAELNEEVGNSMATLKNQAIENNGVANTFTRLSNEEKPYAKMKVYPGMLMKINVFKNGFGNNRECYR